MDSHLLLFRAGTRLCSLAVEQVVEVMRPLPIEPVREAPDFVIGAAMVRGAAVPVVDVHALIAGAPLLAPGRMITVRVAANRCVALLASEVRGVVRAKSAPSDERAPLFDDARTIEKIRELDGALLTVLSTAHLVPDDVWQRWTNPEDRS